MRRVIAFALVIACAAVAAAVAGAAQTDATRTAKAKPKLPPLPAEVKERGRWNIGIKCDSPPFGYIDVQGKNAGFDVEIAKWFSRFAFGKANRISFTCVTTPAREPSLTTGRVDLVIATFTYTPDRDTRIDFSRPYYKATGRLLVRNNSPITKLSDIAGRTIATTSGSIYDRWMKNCYKDTKVLVTDSFTNALLAFRDGRADALMWDDTVLLGIAVADPNLQLTDDLFLPLPYGIGMKQGNDAMKRWVDSRLNLMAKRDAFQPLIKNSVPARNLPTFAKNVLRPGQVFYYSKGDLTTQCT
ncbi:MAG TPA: transporter substrate-binding domain-containing protein [Gaiella sp.]|nr:transporter substrate-binding domain-containing protein [Gaiella sp.]